jgi:hypothetical protein
MRGFALSWALALLTRSRAERCTDSGSNTSAEGAFHVTNAGLNPVQVFLCSKYDDASKTCDPAAVSTCDSDGAGLVPANTSDAKCVSCSTMVVLVRASYY